MKPTNQYNATNAWNVNLNNGNVNNNAKTNGNQVRLVSEFCKHPESPASQDFLDFAASFIEAYLKCIKTKIKNPNAAFYALRGLTSTIQLAEDVWKGEYQISPGIGFVVRRPVWRECFAATCRDRVVHDWIMIREEPVFESVFPKEITANRKGMGTSATIRMAQEKVYRLTEGYARNDLWIYTMDFRGFFMSIDKRILVDAVRKLNAKYYHGRWPQILDRLFAQVTFNCPQKSARRRSPDSAWAHIAPEKSLYCQDDNHGLAIGNLPSQWSACVIVMLALEIIMGHGVVEDCVDYMDDILLFVRDKERFLHTIPQMERELKDKLNLTLHPRKRNLQHYTKGWKIVGGKGRNGRLYASDRTLRRFRAKMHYLRKIHDTQGAFQSLNSHLGILSQFSTFKARKAEADKALVVFGRELCFNGQITKCTLFKQCNLRCTTLAVLRRIRAISERKMFHYKYAI